MCDINSPNCILGKVERVNVEDGTIARTPKEDVCLSRMANGDVMSDGSDEEENHPLRL